MRFRYFWNNVKKIVASPRKCPPDLLPLLGSYKIDWSQTELKIGRKIF